jgi:hypothetical protein
MSEFKQYDNTNKGTLFKNDNARKETDPGYKGQINIEGVEYWVSAWIKTAKKDNSKFFSLSFTPKNRDIGQPTRREVPVDDNDDSIPF